MKWNRIWFLLVTLLVASLFGGMVTQEARAQVYRVDVDFVLQRSFLLGQDIIVLGTLTVLAPRSGPDTVTVTVFSPDTTVPAQALDIDVPVAIAPGQEFAFAIQQLTFVGGNFSVIVTSALEGTLLPSTSYPVSNFDVQVRISALAGQVGTPFVVTTIISVGNMSEMQSRFDVEYVLDGALLRQTSLIALFGDLIAIIQGNTISIVALGLDEAAKSWETTQTFTLEPGAHTLAVRVVDRSVSQTVFTDTFSIQVADQIGDLDTRVDELALELGGRLDQLSGQTLAASQTASAAGGLAGSVFAISLVAIALSALTLLLQFGILKRGRFGRRGPAEPPQPQEPEE